MISPARFREIKQIIEDCTPGEPVSMDKTTAMSLLKAAAVGMLAECEQRGEIARLEALRRRHRLTNEEVDEAERSLNAVPE